MNINELLSKGLIRKEIAKPDEIRGSIVIAKHFAERAEGNLEMDFYDTAFLLAYTGMFHAAKALLLKAGYKERSHFGMVEALKECYKGNRKILNYAHILDTYRISRHAIQYNGELSSELDAIQAIKDCKLFISAVNTELKSSKI